MPHQIECDRELVIIKIHGVWTGKEAAEAQKHAVELFKQHNCSGILVDVRDGKIEASTADIYEVTTGHAIVFPPGTRHAVVLRKNNIDEKDLKFASDLANNRGILLHYFTDYDDALLWLRPNTE